MEKKKKIVTLVIGVLALTLAVSISFGFFTFTSNTGGSSNAVTGTTTTTGETKVVSEEFLSHNDTNIYPGHKSISAIKVTATGVNQVNFNINWMGTNTLGTTYKYTLYKTTTEQRPVFNCQVKTEFKVGVGNTYFEECTSDLTVLGTSLKTGNITPSSEVKTIGMLEDQSLQATEAGNIVYYYIIFEYLNEDKNQSSSDANGKLDGKINIEVLAPKDRTMNEILAGYNTSTRTDFSTVYTEETIKTVFTVEDGLGTSKYFAGAPTDNYVKFGGFYWRIIRMNGDKTTRLIYAGDASVIDNLANKQEVLANGYDDNITQYTQIKQSIFNESTNNNAYVGFKYATGSLRGLSEKSTILGELDTWYETNLKTNYGKYIDGSTGFCGDRTPYTDTSGTTSGGGTERTTTYYGSLVRLFKKNPSLNCANSDDLYTTSGSSRGNKALTNPIGLINGDEIALSGGARQTSNIRYYLRTNSYYWTMSPAMFNRSAIVMAVSADGGIHCGPSSDYVNTLYGVRPVINLKADIIFAGSGTWDDPFTIIES